MLQRGAEIKPADLLIAVAGREAEPPHSPAFEMDRETEITVSRAGERRPVHIDLRTRKPKYKSNPYSEPRSVAASVIEKSVANLKIEPLPGLYRHRFRK